MNYCVDAHQLRRQRVPGPWPALSVLGNLSTCMIGCHFLYAIIKEGWEAPRKGWFSRHVKAISLLYSVLFWWGFQHDPKHQEHPEVRSQLIDSNALGLVEETGKSRFTALKSSLLGTCLPNDKAIVLSVVSETQEETLEPGAARAAGPGSSPGLPPVLELFPAVQTPAFILPILKSTSPSTSINLQTLKRDPVSWSKSPALGSHCKEGCLQASHC